MKRGQDTSVFICGSCAYGPGRAARPTLARLGPDYAGHMQTPENTILLGDCVEEMKKLGPGSVDLVFADPPYNIGFGYDDYRDDKSDEQYLAWTYRWIDASVRALAPTGSFYVLIGDEYAAETRVHLKKLERRKKLLFRNWIVWHYSFGQRCKAKFNRSHAHLFYCVGSAALNPNTGKPRADLTANPQFTFNYEAVAVPSARMTTYRDARTNPRGKLPDDTWVLKGSNRRKFGHAKHWHVRPQPAQAQDGAFPRDADTWFQSRLCGSFKEREAWHPCQLPEALLERVVSASSNPGDLVLDPFAGSGTTLAVAQRLGRRWLGCELSPSYREKALARIERVGGAKGEGKAKGKRRRNEETKKRRPA